jgi:hypothetical protein
MQMFGSCLGFGPEALHSRDRKSTAAAHDVAPRFQQYAKWARYACYDMRYETMFQDRSGEVSRLAKALQIDISKTQASQIVKAVEQLKKNTSNSTWDSTSGFSSEHVHESTSSPGAFSRAETLVQVALKLPSCPVAAAFDFVDRGFGAWQGAHGYASSGSDAYTASLTGDRFPRLAHVFFSEEKGRAVALLKARDAARTHDDVHISLVDAVDDARKRFDYACKADKELASLLKCAPPSSDYVFLVAPGVQLNASTYASLRDKVVDERRPLSKGWAFGSNNVVDALLLPSRWASLLEPMVELRGDHLAVLATAAAHLGKVVYDQVIGLTSEETVVRSSSKKRLAAAEASTKGMGQLLQSNHFARCCCSTGPAPAEVSGEWLWDAESIELERCGLAHLPLLKKRDINEVVKTWCEHAAVAVAANSTLRRRNRAVRVDEACTVIQHSVPSTRACAKGQIQAGEPSGVFVQEPPRRILLVRDAPLRHLEGSDARVLRLVEWLCGRGHRVTLATRGRAANYVGRGDQPPASAKLWFRRRLDLDACSVDVKTDDEGLTRVLAPSALDAAAFDLALLEVNFDARFGDRPAAHVALERFRASRRRPTLVALLSDALHYRQEVAAGAPRASAAAVYGYERLLYAHPSVTAVIAGDAALIPSFKALQVRARPNATQHPPVVFASYRTDVDSESLVGGADAHKHVASYSSRKDVLVVLGPGRGHRQALSQLLGRWRGRRLVVTGHDELREVVEEHCASERGIAAAAAPDDPEPASLEQLADVRRAAPTPQPTRGACSVSYVSLPLVALEGPSPLQTAKAELAKLMAAAYVVIAPAGSTGCFLAIEHGLPVAAPLNSTCGGLVVTCVEIKILRHVRAESSRRPPRHRCDACSRTRLTG